MSLTTTRPAFLSREEVNGTKTLREADEEAVTMERSARQRLEEVSGKAIRDKARGIIRKIDPEFEDEHATSPGMPAISEIVVRKKDDRKNGPP